MWRYSRIVVDLSCVWWVFARSYSFSPKQSFGIYDTTARCNKINAILRSNEIFIAKRNRK